MRSGLHAMLVITFMTMCLGLWAPSMADSIKEEVEKDVRQSVSEIKGSKDVLKETGKQIKKDAVKAGKEVRDGFVEAGEELKNTFKRSGTKEKKKPKK